MIRNLSVLCVIILIPLVLCACTQQEIVGAYLLPNSVAPGETITIQYNRNAHDSKFRLTDSLYLTVTSYTSDEYTILRYVESTFGESIASFSIEVPKGAIYLYLQVGKKELLIETDDICCLIHKNNVPVEGSIAFAIQSATSFEEAEDLYNEDKRLYPHSLARYPSFWQGLKNSGLVSKIQTCELPNSVSMRSINRMARPLSDDILALRALAFFYRAEFEESQRNLQQLLMRTNIHLTTSGYRALIDIWNTIHGHAKGCKLTNDLDRYYTEAIVKTYLQSQHPEAQLMQAIMKVIRSNNPLVSQTLQSRVVERARRMIAKSTDNQILIRMGILSDVLRYLDRVNRSKEVITIVEDKMNAIQRSTLWCGTDEEPWISIFPCYGIESLAMYLYGKALVRVGEVNRGNGILRNLIQRTARPEYIYAICKSIDILAEQSASRHDTSAVKRYYHKSNDCDCSDETIRKILRHLNINEVEVVNGSGLRNKVNYKIPISDIVTTEGHIKLDAKDNVFRLLLFTGSQCSVCKSEYPEIIKIATEWSSSIEIFYIDSEGKFRKDEIRGYEQYIRIVLNYEQVFNAFNIGSIPDLRLIRNGQVIMDGIANAYGFREGLKSIHNRF